MIDSFAKINHYQTMLMNQIIKHRQSVIAAVVVAMATCLRWKPAQWTFFDYQSVYS